MLLKPDREFRLVFPSSFFLLFLLAATVSSFDSQQNTLGATSSSFNVQRTNAADTGGGLEALKQVMIERDLRARGIKDERVLQAMAAVPRELFVPARLRSSAYEDRPLPIGQGQTISQPYIVAFMTEALELRGSETVLEIGTGSGYQAAVLAKLAARVFSIEIIPALSHRAKQVLTELGFSNIQLKVGDGFYGWPENAPFDAIIMTAAAPKIPEALWLQLREGGRLLMPLGPAGASQKLVRVRKIAGKQSIEDLTDVLFVPLTGAGGKRSR